MRLFKRRRSPVGVDAQLAYYKSGYEQVVDRLTALYIRSAEDMREHITQIVQWKERAEKAEAVIARVRQRCQEGRDGPYSHYTNVVKDDVLDILDGDGQ